jgi:DNA repair protein RadA/Sms
MDRVGSGIPGFDVVLGGGLVPGSLVLIAGEPGAGKSTLMLQIAAGVAAGGMVLYVSGEESESQLKMRGKRLGVDPRALYVFSETELERVLDACEKLQPELLIVDSVQTSYSTRFSSAPGSVTQVRETAAALLMLAKNTGISILLVGHVTKGGQIAGPKTMEHIVDTVVMLEGERFHSLRILRALKNRFGPVSELAVFEMRSEGLVEVGNVSELFLAERAKGTPGSAVTAAVEGTRTMLVEAQALVSPAAYGSGRRTSEGFDHNRLALLLAILERRGGLEISTNDVFVNVVGGVRLDEPAADLAVAAAVASSLLDKPLPEGAVVVGELGLGGEVRSVTSAELRCKEAATIGMTDLFLPARNAAALKKRDGLEFHPVKTLEGFITEVFRS